MKVFFYTLGCRVNQYETDAVRKLFIENGFTVCETPEEADVCVVNTCTVTGEADRKSRQQLRRMSRLNPNAVICAMGCSTQMNKGDIDADVICGTRDKHLIVQRLQEFLDTGRKADHKGRYGKDLFENEGYAEFGTVLSPEKTRAFIKVEDGCNNFCTYCIIPYARGRVVSRDSQSVLDEVGELAAQGISEVCVTGIHLCSYGKEKGEDIMTLYKLIHDICSVDGITRVSLGSLEPISLTDEFLEALAAEKKLSPHFHLSLQSGSDTVLKRMNRRYDTAGFLDRVNKLRSLFDCISLTTDIICGFPGETEEEFQETLDFVDACGFNKVHVFPYSLREGTMAAKMPQVDKKTAKDRSLRLIAVSDERERAFAASFFGKDAEIMVETYETSGDLVSLCGYTKEYVYARTEPMKCDDPGAYIGKLLDVRVIGSTDATVSVSLL